MTNDKKQQGVEWTQYGCLIVWITIALVLGYLLGSARGTGSRTSHEFKLERATIYMAIKDCNEDLKACEQSKQFLRPKCLKVDPSTVGTGNEYCDECNCDVPCE